MMVGKIFPIAKRLIDVIGASLAIMALFPIMVMIAFFVRRDGGPAIYKDRRIGMDGCEFDCLKFRSMVLNGDLHLAKHLANDPIAAEEWITTRKLKNDPRVTPIGRILRKTSLDELPQFFNVLIGDMSLVGPRPVGYAELVQRYGVNLDVYTKVRPGITGPWQISGRSNIGYDRRVIMDVEYVRNPSFVADTSIFIKTPMAVFSKRGAY